MFKLVISDDEGKTTVVPLVRDEITIGRKEGNTIRLTERNVSRRHARLRRKNGTFVVEDLGSYNGVKINGDRVDGEIALSAGDRVGIGDYELALQLEGTEREAPADASERPSSADLAEPVPPARLVMLTAPAPGAEYALGNADVRIGRSEDLEVWVNHRSISREHAKFSKEGDVFIVRDLDSANGVRLNGSDVREAELESGDILELGQVRFRFVAEGETYVYDAEDANVVEKTTARTRGHRAPIMAAVVIIVVAVAVGAAIAAGGPHGQPAITADPAPATAEPAESEPDEEAISRAAEAARGCEAAVAERRFDDALRFAAEALSANPDNETAAACRAMAQAGAAEGEIFARGAAALAAGDVDTAYFVFEELPVESPLRADESVVGARAMFVERRLQLARRAIAREPAEAIRQANIVLSVDGLGETERHEAESLIARARRRVPESGDGTATPSAARAPAAAPAPAPAAAPEAAAAPTASRRRTASRTSASSSASSGGPGATLTSPSAGAGAAPEDDLADPVPLD